MSDPALVFFRKELRDLVRNRLFLLLVGGLGVVVVVSVIVAAAAFHAKVVDYQNYVNAMTQAGQVASINPPQLFPLQLLRGPIEYLEIVGSMVAIVVGYSLMAKEKNRGTLRLLHSRPISPWSPTVGKVLSLAVMWLVVTAVLGLIMAISLIIVGGASLSAEEIAKLAFAVMFSWLYLFMWSVFSYGLSGRTKHLGTALVAGLVLWLAFVLIVPQIGDTMDPDNQVPGGLFRSLQVEKPQEKAVMAHFSGYETTRNFIEETSISKHYERATFAYLGIKDTYNQQPLSLIARDMWANVTWLVAATAAATGFAVISGPASNRRHAKSRRSKTKHTKGLA